MAYAFQRLRPLFRERGKIQAEVSGRLTEALGGIRIVKSYTAEKREEIVFTKGAHKLFRNIAQSMTGVSATTSGSTVIVGVVGVVMIWMGGNDILAGRMTLGDFIMYIFFIGLLAAPLISIASIGTQITEAFAGPRPHPRDPRHGDRGRVGRRQGLARRDPRRHPLRGRVVRVQPGQPGAEGRDVPRRAGDHDRAGRFERLGQEHADQPGDGLQPAAEGAHPHRRPRSGGDSAARLSRAAGVGAAGELPVRRHGGREHRLRQARLDAGRDQARRPGRALRGVHPALPRGLRHGGGGARHQAVRAASASACRLRARSWRSPRC